MNNIIIQNTPGEFEVSNKYNVQTPDRVRTQEIKEVKQRNIKTTKRRRRIKK